MSFPSLFSVEDQGAFVAGAGSGLGTEFAQIMAEAGADVVCTDIGEAAAHAIAKQVDGLGRRGLALRCDVTDETEVREAFATTRQEFGHTDSLFNNAGIADPNPAPLHQYSTENWIKVLDVDLHGVFFCAREALKIMVEQGHGKIINITSMWESLALPASSPFRRTTPPRAPSST